MFKVICFYLKNLNTGSYLSMVDPEFIPEITNFDREQFLI
ncbi:hypothetical protein FEDK69T_29240 [Flavobacterium enshiense DK69]|nr:hypothetical protein FEDK69T_29240 [Flavobacterium enshiense DK69]